MSGLFPPGGDREAAVLREQQGTEGRPYLAGRVRFEASHERVVVVVVVVVEIVMLTLLYWCVCT